MNNTRRQMFVALLAVGFLAAGCVGDDGGSGDDEVASLSEDDSSDGGGSDMEAEFMEWAECMRDEGVDMPDPVQNADGDWVIDGPGGLHLGPDDEDEGSVPPDDVPTEAEIETIEEAEQACVSQEPPLSASQEEERKQQEAEAFEFAQCMRDEGVADFPDPDFSAEGPGAEPQPQIAEDPSDDQAGTAEVVQGPFGEIDMDDPGVAAAFEACQGQDVIGTRDGSQEQTEGRVEE